LAEKRFRETPLALKVTIEGWVFTKSAPVKPTRVPIDSQGSITEAESQRGEGLYNRLVNKEERLLSDVEASDARQESSLGTGALLLVLVLLRVLLVLVRLLLVLVLML